MLFLISQKQFMKKRTRELPNIFLSLRFLIDILNLINASFSEYELDRLGFLDKTLIF